MDLCERVDRTYPDFESIEVFRSYEIAFIEQDDICKGDLFARFLAVIKVRENVLRVDEGDNGINEELIFQLIVDKKRLDDRSGIGEPGCFDEDLVELILPFHEVAEDADEVASHGAADAAVIHFEQLLIGIDDEIVINPDLAELIFDHGDPEPVVLGEDPVEERRFSGT